MTDHSFDRYIKARLAAEEPELPDAVRNRVEQTLSSLPERIGKRRLVWPRAVTSLAACVAALLLVVLPNISTAYAAAVAEIPMIGDLVRVFTIRNYFFDNGKRELNAEIPEVSDPVAPTAGDAINGDIEALTQTVIREFYQDVERYEGDGYHSVTISYEIVTNTERWFTLKLTISERSASSGTVFQYYHIDRTTGTAVTFGDLFEDAAYPALERMILTQMKEQMAQSGEVSYWVEGEEDSVSLQADQNFYFTEDGSLVIVYHQYEVAPGFMGCPAFELSREEYGAYMTPYFAKILEKNSKEYE